MRYVVLIPDGAGDHPHKALQNKTPLEAAHTPCLDSLAQKAEIGLSENIPKGFTPGTDIGCMSIFGYDPNLFYTGRGPLEAAQLGVLLEGADLAFRCNLITAQGDVVKDYSADHVSVSESEALMESLNEHFRNEPVRFYAGKGTGYRNLMILSNPDDNLTRLKLSPPHDIMSERIDDHLPTGILKKLMIQSRDHLEAHPVNKARASQGRGKANMIWLWGQGRSRKWPTYPERFGKRGSVITAVDLVKGIGIYSGLDIVNVPGVTGYFDTNYAGKAHYALNALKKQDIVIIHIESTDEAGHMGEIDLKVKALEDIDRLVVKTLVEGLSAQDDFKILVVPDHYTCIETRTHASDPVPYMIYSSRKPLPGKPKYCERTAAQNSQDIIPGFKLIERLLGQ